MRSLAKALQARALARVAVAALALGIFALAGLALWSADRTERDTARLDEINEIAARWGSLFEALNVQDAAMGDYLNAGDEIGRQPLESALTLGTADLAWLKEHSELAARSGVTLVADAYLTYTRMLNQMVELGRRGDVHKVAMRGKAAALMADTLRKQLTANIAHRRLEISAHLAEAKRFNQRLQAAGVTIFAVDMVLLLLCTVVILSYQRRVERQAAESGHQALHDTLTGLPNRALLHNRLEQAVKGAARAEEPVALMLVDLDRFKEVNDTLGHHVGDLLLQTVATRLSGAVRGGDTVARLGGDEFAVLMPAVGGAVEAGRLANRLLEALRQPADLNGIPVNVDGSIGIALYPQHSADAVELLQHADVAMYTAKRGHLGTAIYDADEDDTDIRNLTLLGDLRRALDRGELLLHYQPEVGAAGGAVHAVEALVRWQHPDHGLLLSEEFVPLAEDSGLVDRLTRYVLTAALDQCHRWHCDGRQLPVSVNLAAGCLQDPEFPSLVSGLLNERQLPATLLILELPGRALACPGPEEEAVLARLREIGVRLAVDDFTGAELSAEQLRAIDVRQLKTDARAAADVLPLARDLGLQVTAQGVDDEATWTSVRAAGCPAGQGHWLGTARPAADITRWLAGRDVARRPSSI